MADIEIIIGARDMASKVLNKVSTSTKRMATNVRGVGKSLGGMAFSMQGLAAQLAGGAAFRTMSNELERIDELAKKSRKLGLPTDELVAFRLAADEMSGVSADTLDMALQRMTRRVSEAAIGTGEARDALAELGLNAEQMNLEGPSASFRMIADAMGDVENPADRLRLAFKLFDSEGAALVTTLEGGSGAIDEMKLKADELGLTVGEKVAAQVERTNDSVTEMKASFTGAVSEITTGLAPALEVLAEGLTTVAQAAGEAAKWMKEVFPETVDETVTDLMGGTQGTRFGMSVSQGSIAQQKAAEAEREARAAQQRQIGFGGGNEGLQLGTRIRQWWTGEGDQTKTMNKKLEDIDKTLKNPLKVTSVDAEVTNNIVFQQVN